MSLTEEHRIYKEFVENRRLIATQLGEESVKGKEGIEKLEYEYAKLLRNYRLQLKNPSFKLKTLQSRLEDVFELVSLWSAYVDIIYMPEADIHIIDAVNKTGARPDELSFQNQNEERDLNYKMKVLFGKDDDVSKPAKSVARKAEDEEGFETVREGNTSDTTEAPRDGVRRTQV